MSYSYAYFEGANDGVVVVVRPEDVVAFHGVSKIKPGHPTETCLILRGGCSIYVRASLDLVTEKLTPPAPAVYGEPQISANDPPPGVSPPLRHRHLEFHWITSERAERPMIVEWMDRNWFCFHEVGHITPVELYRRGWRYHRPVEGQ